MRIMLVLALLALCVLQGCGLAADISAAENAISKFHTQLDAAQYNDIYDQSSPSLKEASTKADFIKLLTAVHHKLGVMKSTQKGGWFINTTLAGTFVTLTYHTEYAEGGADEQFVYQLKDKTASLAGYHINSMALITK
jgi:hypothetical protein